MAHDDPFTIDLFGNTALSSGLGLGVTAFAGDFTPEPDDDDDPDPSTPAPAIAGVKASRAVSPGSRTRGENFHIVGDRVLAKGWKARARDNIAAIRPAAEIEAAERPATRAEQEKLIRFTGFGASDLANGVFRQPGEVDFREGWDEIGSALEDAVGEADYASLSRCTQYAHFTPEFIVRAIWAGLQRLGWRAAGVFGPGSGPGLLRGWCPEGRAITPLAPAPNSNPARRALTGLLQPRARILSSDFAHTELPPSFDLAIGNPPFPAGPCGRTGPIVRWV